MKLANGGSGGVVACLGVGGLVDLAGLLGVATDDEGNSGPDGVDIWVFDSRRPWNLTNLFGGTPATVEGVDERQQAQRKDGVYQGELTRDYRPGKGGIIVFDDGDIQTELAPQREAWYALEEMPDLGDDNESIGSDSDCENGSQGRPSSLPRKRKSWSENDEDTDGSEKENARPTRRQRSNSVSLVIDDLWTC